MAKQQNTTEDRHIKRIEGQKRPVFVSSHERTCARATAEGISHGLTVAFEDVPEVLKIKTQKRSGLFYRERKTAVR